MTQKELLKLFQLKTGKTTIVPKAESRNPYGYQRSRVDEYKFGGLK
jgi:hypothetical protein